MLYRNIEASIGQKKVTSRTDLTGEENKRHFQGGQYFNTIEHRNCVAKIDSSLSKGHLEVETTLGSPGAVRAFNRFKTEFVLKECNVLVLRVIYVSTYVSNDCVAALLAS